MQVEANVNLEEDWFRLRWYNQLQSIEMQIDLHIALLILLINVKYTQNGKKLWLIDWLIDWLICFCVVFNLLKPSGNFTYHQV
jgi:hypothetical protein